MKNFIILVFIATSFFVSSLSAKAFHLLVMGDTQDSSIKQAVSKNLQNVEASFSYLSKVSDIPLLTTKLTCTEKTLTRDHILKWIRNEPVAHDDVIILYYSGHGARTEMSPTIWPFACFPETNAKEIELSEVVEKLFLKKAALYLILIESCNEVIKSKALPCTNEGIPFKLEGFNDQIVAQNCKELFFKSYGLIIASASSPEEGGWYNVNPKYPKVLGGVFTKVFLNYFFRELHSTHPQWQHMFKKTKKECIAETKKSAYELINDTQHPHSYQTPQYKIFLYKRRRSSHVYKKCFLKHSNANQINEMDSKSLSIDLPACEFQLVFVS